MDFIIEMDNDFLYSIKVVKKYLWKKYINLNEGSIVKFIKVRISGILVLYYRLWLNFGEVNIFIYYIRFFFKMF